MHSIELYVLILTTSCEPPDIRVLFTPAQTPVSRFFEKLHSYGFAWNRHLVYSPVVERAC